MFISIVIPTLNRPDFLKQCLQALHKQISDSQDIEVVVVDDCSSEICAAINKNMCAAYGFSYIAHEINRGMAVARNTGIKNSKGLWVVFLDDDVCVEEDWYQQLKRQLSTVARHVMGIEGKVVGSGSGIWDREVQNLQGKAYLTCHIIFRREVLDRTGGFDEQFQWMGPFCEDHELASRVLLLGEIIFNERLSVIHLPRKVNLLRYITMAPKRIRGLLQADYFFYSKHPDRYHLFRHARTFWGTFYSILVWNCVKDLRRRSIAMLLTHPLQTAAMVAGSIIEQLYAWTLIPLFIKKYFGMNTVLQIDNQKTAQTWKITEEHISLLRISANLHRSLLFPIVRKAVYNALIPVRKLHRVTDLCELRLFIRIDDVFLDRKEQVAMLCGIMKKRGVPWLAAVKGDDLVNEEYSDLSELLSKSGADVGLHGFTHEGTFGPFTSELLQMNRADFSQRFTHLSKILRADKVPKILVPPFNAVGPHQIAQYSSLFKVICGGPETARFTGKVFGPVALATGAWYFPSFFPFYGSAQSILQSRCLNELKRLHGYVCLTLHFTEELRDEFRKLEELLDTLSSKPVSWQEFI